MKILKISVRRINRKRYNLHDKVGLCEVSITLNIMSI